MGRIIRAARYRIQLRHTPDTMPKQVKVRYHILSIRDNPEDERLIEQVWGVDPDIHIVHVECGVEALEFLQKADHKIPNMILLAWRFRENHMTAIETLAALKTDAILKLVPVIVLAQALSPFHIQELYSNQVACVLEMPHQPEALGRVLHTMKDLWMHNVHLPYGKAGLPLQEFELTEREKEIVLMSAEDLSNKEIAGRLGISIKTVEFHRNNIRRRLGVQGTAGMVRYAIRNRLIEA